MKRYIVIAATMLIAFTGYSNNHGEQRSIEKKSIKYVDKQTIEVFERMPSKAKEVEFNKQTYGYREGIFFVSVDTGYIQTDAPTGIVVKKIPKEYQRLIINGQILYFSKGVFYQMLNKKAFRVTYGPKGAQIQKLPENCAIIEMNKRSYFLTNGAVFRKGLSRTRNYYELVGYVQE